MEGELYLRWVQPSREGRIFSVCTSQELKSLAPWNLKSLPLEEYLPLHLQAARNVMIPALSRTEVHWVNLPPECWPHEVWRAEELIAYRAGELFDLAKSIKGV